VQNKKIMLDADLLDLDLREIIQDAISEMICKKLSLPDEIFLCNIEYLPTYRLNEHRNKTLSNLYIKLVAQNNFKVVTFSEIEKTGATYDEVLEFLLFAGARKLRPKEIYNT